MMLQRFAILLMMCRIPAPTPGGRLPGVGVATIFPSVRPSEVRHIVSPTIKRGDLICGTLTSW